MKFHDSASDREDLDLFDWLEVYLIQTYEKYVIHHNEIVIERLSI